MKPFLMLSGSARALQTARNGAEQLHNQKAQKAQGFALIDLIFVCGVIGVLSSVALPRLALARQSAGSASAIGSMRTINSAQLIYALTCGSGFYAPNLTTLGTAPAGSNQPFIGGGLGVSDTVVKGGYIIQMNATPFAGSPLACNGAAAGATGQGFVAAADPGEPGNKRFFATNAESLIYEHTSTLYAVMPEVGSPPVGQMMTGR